MFKAFTSVFKKKPVVVINVTPELVQKRHRLSQNLQQIYKSQIDLMNKSVDNIAKVPLINHYIALNDQYKTQYKEICDKSFENIDYSEENFLKLINKQLDFKVSELEAINNKITIDELLSLDENYTDQIDGFFFKFHIDRINASFSLKEYIYHESLLQKHSSEKVLNDAIKSTSKILSLNDYPIPKFVITKSQSEFPEIYCIAPHIIHIMFELFKNATIPSITHNKPITINIIDDIENENVIYEIIDNGGGMPTQMLGKIWQFHYTTSKETDRDVIHGFGMGLPLCKVFAKFNNGSLDLINRQGDGVTVRLTLPKFIEK